jgi:hypothetical protein
MCRSGALEILHLALSSSGWLMRVLRSMVAPSAALMAFCDSEITGCGRVRAQVIRDEFIWNKSVFLQKLVHQSQRRILVPPALDQHVEHFAFGVDGPPQIDHAAIDLQIDFVEMPGRMGPGPALAQVGCNTRPEMVHPAPNGLLPLLRQKLRRWCLVGRLQHGHRERRRASAIMSCRRMVAIAFGM